MNEASNQPQGPGNRKQRRRKRTFGHQAQNGQNQARQGGGGGQNRRNNRNNRGQRRNAPFVGPMDHSYRNQNGGSQGGRFNGGSAGELEPLPQRQDAPTRIFALIDRCCFQGHTHVPGVFTESLQDDSFQFQSPEEIDYLHKLDQRKTMINVG